MFVYPPGWETGNVFYVNAPTTSSKCHLKSIVTEGPKFSHFHFVVCEGCEPFQRVLTEISRVTQIVWHFVCVLDRKVVLWSVCLLYACVGCDCVSKSLLVCDSSSVFEAVPAGFPSGLSQAHLTESLLMTTELLSSRRRVCIQARAHVKGAGTFSTTV